MIVFKNDGEIDVRSITTFGVSVKEGDNPIGFFGTGLKYAIAVLLRTGHKVDIYSGLNEYSFDVKSTEVRGSDFDLVTISENYGNPRELGFTTQLGKQWELWAAYREMACNCKDEGGESTYESETPEPESGKTIVIVRGSDFETVFAKRHEFILEDAPDFSTSSMQIRMRPSNAYYYRGVRVAKMDNPALFTYNDIDYVELTEDRTMKHDSFMRINVASAVLESDQASFIKSCVLAKDCFEENLDFDGWRTPSETFMEVVGGLVTDKMCQLNQTALKAWKKHAKKNINPTEIVLTKVQQSMLENALNFVDGIGFKVRGSYPIKFVESLGEGILGLAKDDTIYIVERVLHQGTKALASTLIEEYIHLKHGYRDKTYEMQTYLFDKIISLAEELNGKPI